MLLGIGLLASTGGLASAGETAVISFNVTSDRTISVGAVGTVPALRPSGSAGPISGGSATYSSVVASPGTDRITVYRTNTTVPADGAAAVVLKVAPSGLTCSGSPVGCSGDAGVAVDGDLATGEVVDAVTIPTGVGSATPIITGITDMTSVDMATVGEATATLAYYVTTTSAPVGAYSFTITYIIAATP